MLAQESPMMRKANATIELMEMSPRDKWLYESRMKYEHDRASCINEGYQQGIERGFADGSYQTKLETAKLLKQLGDPIQKITQVTGLSELEVEAL